MTKEEITNYTSEVTAFIQQRFSEFLRDENFERLLPPDAAGQARFEFLIEKFKSIANIENTWFSKYNGTYLNPLYGVLNIAL